MLFVFFLITLYIFPCIHFSLNASWPSLQINRKRKHPSLSISVSSDAVVYHSLPSLSLTGAYWLLRVFLAPSQHISPMWG